MRETKHKLFVYGTLRAGHRMSRNLGLDGTSPVTANVTVDGFQMFDLGSFPGIIPGKGQVTGDIFDVDPKYLPGLDSYEGVPYLYRRETIEVPGHGSVFTYVYNTNSTPHRRVEQGDWNDYVRQQ